MNIELFIKYAEILSKDNPNLGMPMSKETIKLRKKNFFSGIQKTLEGELPIRWAHYD